MKKGMGYKKLDSESAVILTAMLSLVIFVGFLIAGQTQTRGDIYAVFSLAEGYSAEKAVIEPGDVTADGSFEISQDMTDLGILLVRYTGDYEHIVIVMEKDETESLYPARNDGSWTKIPLAYGPGVYQLEMLSVADGVNIASETASFVIHANFPPNSPFLLGNDFVDFEEGDALSLMGGEIIRQKEAKQGRALTDLEKALAVTEFICLRINSPSEKENLREEKETYGYRFPKIEKVVTNHIGNCADKTAVAAAMLRSQGIPTRVCYGYIARENSTDAYHAWYEVFADGRWAMFDVNASRGEILPETTTAFQYQFDTVKYQ